MTPPGEPQLGELAAFHDVGRLFPGQVSVVSVSPNTSVLEAIRLMRECRFSQLPVVDGDGVHGVFSLWSVAELAQSAGSVDVKGLTVGDFVESVPSVSSGDSLHFVYEQVMKYEALLFNGPHGVQAIVTPPDLLSYFYQVARPFALVQEIELALRALIAHCTPGEQLNDCIKLTLSSFFERAQKPLPSSLSELTFSNYVTLITSSKTYGRFEPVLGKAKDMVTARLDRVGSLRNDVFHFRRELSVLDHQSLVTSRDWLARKLRDAGIIGRGALADA